MVVNDEVRSKMLGQIDKVKEALDELSLTCFDPETKEYTNEDLSDYVDNIRSLMSFANAFVGGEK